MFQMDPSEQEIVPLPANANKTEIKQAAMQVQEGEEVVRPPSREPEKVNI